MGFLDAFKAVCVPSGQALGRAAPLAVFGTSMPLIRYRFKNFRGRAPENG
jgi:hypothetical protein